MLINNWFTKITFLIWKYRINVETETWGREACELIDYDSKNLYKSSFEIKNSGYLYRSENEIIFSQEPINEKSYQQLLIINEAENTFEIERNKITRDKNDNIASPNAAWFLLKQTKMNAKFDKYKIHQGEIIKIGRIITRIKEIRFDKKKKSDNNNNNNNNNTNVNGNSLNNSKNSNKFVLRDIDDDILLKKNGKLQLGKEYYNKMVEMANQRNATDSDFQDKVQIITLNNNKNCKTINSSNNNKTLTITHKEKKNKYCRICYMEEDDENENPIIQPCHCSGSCKYIHLKCLKQWINTKNCLKVDQNDFCSVFVFTESECEICKTKFPDLVNHFGKLHSLLDFSDEFKNYMILESLTLDKENNKFLYVISLDKNAEIKVGRGQFCDILLSDVSVSRVHCLLTIDGKNIYIQDNDSKFGTLILLQSPKIKLAEDLPLYIQVGRTFFNFLATKEKLFSLCCGVSDIPNYFYYHKQNEREIENNRVFTVKQDSENDNDSDEEIENKNEINEIKNGENKGSEIEEIINI